MAEKFLRQIAIIDGLVQAVDFRELTVDDLPRPAGLVPATSFGSITTNPQGQVTSSAGLADGTYYSFTVAGGLVAGSTVAPSGGASRIVTQTATVGTIGTMESDLYSDSIAGTVLAANGDALEGVYTGQLVATNDRTISLYFGGTLLFTTNVFFCTNASMWNLRFTIARVSSTVVRGSYVFQMDEVIKPAADFTALFELTGLTLSSANVLKVTGTCGAGSSDNDITATMAVVTKLSA